MSISRNKAYRTCRGETAAKQRDALWAEVGSVDSRGHNEGVKTAKTLEQEVRDIASRIRELLDAGWREVVVVTDHGCCSFPVDLPKVNLSHFVVEHRWGRCAAVKAMSATELPTVPWYWNPDVTIATPPGAGCFRAGLEYAHGGLSVQEIVVPRLTIRAGVMAPGQAKISAVKWVGLRCRVSVQNAVSGMKADIRGRPADARSSKVEGGQPREIGSDCTVSLPVGDDLRNRKRCRRCPARPRRHACTYCSHSNRRERMNIEMDALDRIATEAFEGVVVRKDLVRRFKGQYPVPTYVAEFRPWTLLLFSGRTGNPGGAPDR